MWKRTVARLGGRGKYYVLHFFFRKKLVIFTLEERVENLSFLALLATLQS